MARKNRSSVDYVVPRIGDNECREGEASSLGSIRDDPDWYPKTVVAAVGETTDVRPLDRKMRSKSRFA